MFRVVLGEHDRTATSGREIIVSIKRIIVVSLALNVFVEYYHVYRDLRDELLTD